jgi:ubiquinone/menaquinone biosynthesis C-methylase UbiE
MSRLGVWLLLATNRILPRPDLPDPASTDEVTRWQFRTSDLMLDLLRGAGERPRRVLDLGSGRGGKSLRLSQELGPDSRVVALDISRAHLREAERVHREHGHPALPKVQADAFRLPFPSGAFNCVVCVDLLEHLARPRRALSEMHRCLRREGKLILVFNPWGSPRGSHLGELLRLPWCQHFFSPETLMTATVQAARQRASRADSAERARAIEEYGRDLALFFREHVHPTRIREFRSWIREDGLFVLEREQHAGPRLLGQRGWLRKRWIEEWLTASYGAVLRPL